jgi:hypothetical protein
MFLQSKEEKGDWKALNLKLKKGLSKRNGLASERG